MKDDFNKEEDVKENAPKSIYVMPGQTRFEPTEEDKKTVAALEKKLGKNSLFDDESGPLPCQAPWL